jgi:DNA modification methylase
VTSTLTPNLAVLVPLTKLRPHPANPRTITTTAFERLKHALEADPNHLWQRPLAARSDGTVYCGNMRLLALQKLGWTEAPVVYEDLPAKEEDLRRLRDNASYGEDDDQAIAELLYHLKEQDADLTLTGFDDAAVSKLLDSVSGPELLTDDADMTPPADPVTKPGDLWLLGEHRLLCGDSTNITDVERLMAGRKANLVVTSPPYAEQRKQQYGGIAPDQYLDWFSQVAGNVWAILSDNGSFLLNIKEHCEDGERHLYVKKLIIHLREQLGWRFVDEFCWRDKRDGVPGGWPNRFKDAWEPVFHLSKQQEIKFRPGAVAHASDGVFDYDPGNAKAESGSGLLGSEKAQGYRDGLARPSNVIEAATETGQGEHVAPFPLALPDFFIRAFTDRRDAVFDPFAGSGTTVVAATTLGRTGFGMELSPAYCDVIVRRWETLTGKTATLEPRKEV